MSTPQNDAPAGMAIPAGADTKAVIENNIVPDGAKGQAIALADLDERTRQQLFAEQLAGNWMLPPAGPDATTSVITRPSMVEAPRPSLPMADEEAPLQPEHPVEQPIPPVRERCEQHAPMKPPVPSDIMVEQPRPRINSTSTQPEESAPRSGEPSFYEPDLSGSVIVPRENNGGERKPATQCEAAAAYSQVNPPQPKSERCGNGKDAVDIFARLKDRMADLAHELLGQPNQSLSTKNELRYGSKGSVAVQIEGTRAGCWYDHENGVGGGALDLIQQEKSLTKDDAFKWARRWVGVSDTSNDTTRTSDQSDTHSPTHEPANDNAVSTNTEPDDAAVRAQKLAIILSSCDRIAGTSAELYLRNRGITEPPPDCIRFRPRAFNYYGALVALATDAEGNVLAAQQVYVTKDGAKAPLAVVKRTNKGVDGWAEKSAVRLPGKPPIILAEGPETALSIWQATGHETWACLGVANIGRAPVPEGAAVIIARDGDEPGSKADRKIGEAAASLVRRGHSVALALPPEGQDFNDVLVKQGPEIVRKLIDEARSVDRIESIDRPLDIGSDVEISQRVRKDLIHQLGNIVHAEGAFWRYARTHWEPIPDYELRRAVHPYDGAPVWTGSGKPSQVKLSKGRIDSVLNECAALCAHPGFFEKRPTGINCASGFIRFSAVGSPTIEPHNRDHRCRHTLPGRWEIGANGNPPNNSMLHRLLDGVFHGDTDAAEKIALLSEVCGSAALGYATQLVQPRCVILFGQTAENGKSQILDLARGLLPPSAVCSVPAARMGDERHIVGLVGKLLNATDELSAGAIASDTFKSVVTGEPVEGRDVYKSRVEFRSVAQNLFATNNLPPFLGGMDRGVQRRLLVVPFNRTIPMEERVEFIGQRIAKEESDLLLAWAVDGASRLIRQRNFSIPASCKQALTDWICAADPVLAWLSECVEVRPIVNHQPTIATRTAYDHFHAWAIAEGFKEDKLPAINGFVQRVLANKTGIEKHRTGYGRQFDGLVLREPEVPF